MKKLKPGAKGSIDKMPRRTKKKVRYFEDLSLGEFWEAPSRTHTEALFYAFQLASGDNRPLHYDMEYCKSLGLPGLVAHGFQVLAQCAPGASDMSRGEAEIRILGMLETSAKFLAPVYSGDTVYPALEIIGLEPQRTTGAMLLRTTVHNQRDELCFEGQLRMLLAKRIRDGVT